MGASVLPMPLQQPSAQNVKPTPGGVPVSNSPTTPISFNPTTPQQVGGANNPYAPVGVSAIPQNTTASASTNAPTGTGTTVPAGTVQNNGINWADGSNTVTGDFKDTYGAGTGTAITDVLQNMGTVDDSAIQATIANTDLAAGKQYANIQSNEAAAGVTANSSTAALASGDFYSGVNSQLQSTIANTEVGEEDTLLNTLVGEGSAHGTDESTLDSIMNGVSDAASLIPGVSQIASSATSAINPNADTSVLDALGGI